MSKLTALHILEVRASEVCLAFDHDSPLMLVDSWKTTASTRFPLRCASLRLFRMFM
jgi:hypothetical protein